MGLLRPHPPEARRDTDRSIQALPRCHARTKPVMKITIRKARRYRARTITPVCMAQASCARSVALVFVFSLVSARSKNRFAQSPLLPLFALHAWTRQQLPPSCRRSDVAVVPASLSSYVRSGRSFAPLSAASSLTASSHSMRLYYGAFHAATLHSLHSLTCGRFAHEGL